MIFCFMLPAIGSHRVTLNARVVVCEKGNQWAVALRRALGPTGYRVVETRSLEECWRELGRNPASFVALELVPGNAEAVIRRLLDLGRRFHHAQAVVLAERGLESYEWVLREAGAIHVLCSPRNLSAAARLVNQYMQGVSEPALGVHETVWRKLPWADRAQVL